VLLPGADARAGSCLGIFDSSTHLGGTQLLELTRIGFGTSQCPKHRGGLQRHGFRRFYEFVQVALLGTGPFHHPSRVIADACEVF